MSTGDTKFSAPVSRIGHGGMFNYGADYPATSRNLRRLRAAKGRVRAGVHAASAYSAAASGVIACLGDSNTRGTGSDGGALNGTAGYNGWPVRLAELLTLRGVKAQCENFFCTGGYGGNFSSYDNRIVISGSGVSQSALGAGIQSVAGSLFAFTATGSLTFTTKTNCTQADIYYYGTSSAGSISWAVDGGSATTQSLVQSSSGVYKLTISLGSLATHSIALAWVSGSSYVMGIDAYDATTPLMRVWNWGNHGSTTANWAISGSSGYLPMVAIPNFLKPDLIVGPALGVNDMNTSNNYSVATVMANKLALISSWAAVSDTLLLTEGPSAAATVPSLAVQRTYNDIDYQIAGSRGLPLVDEFAAMGDEAFMNGLGLYNADLLHKTAAGHYATAELVANAIMAA